MFTAGNALAQIGYIVSVTKTYSTILMKKFLLSAILALSAIVSVKAQRCTINLYLTSQHDIDTLSAATKSCTIQSIVVSGSGINNLEGLSGIGIETDQWPALHPTESVFAEPQRAFRS